MDKPSLPGRTQGPSVFRKLFQRRRIGSRAGGRRGPQAPCLCVVFAVSGSLTEERSHLEALCVDPTEEGAW